MLRIGLTGGLGSGKSSAAMLFAQHGAYVLQADEIARELMQPGEAVYNSIVQHFGSSVVLADGQLNRSELARLAFAEGRVEELNAIVHPATIAEQAAIASEIFTEDPKAIIVVESALLFETQYGAIVTDEGTTPWRKRFDCIILVVAPEEVKINRYVQRVAGSETLTSERRSELEAEARRRLAQQISDDEKIPLSDFVLANDGTLQELEEQIEELWPMFQFASSNTML